MFYAESIGLVQLWPWPWTGLREYGLGLGLALGGHLAFLVACPLALCTFFALLSVSTEWQIKMLACLLALAWPLVELTGLGLEGWGLGLGTSGLVNIPGNPRGSSRVNLEATGLWQ